MRVSGRSITYAYDQLNRLASAQSGADCLGQAVPPWSGGPNSQGYDRYGNLSKINGTQSGTGCSQYTLSVSVNSNKQINSSGFAYAHVESNGQVEPRGKREMHSRTPWELHPVTDFKIVQPSASACQF